MELTDPGKVLLDHAIDEDMRELVRNPVELASKIINEHSEDLAAKAASLTKMGAPNIKTSSHVLRADTSVKTTTKTWYRLACTIGTKKYIWYHSKQHEDPDSPRSCNKPRWSESPHGE